MPLPRQESDNDTLYNLLSNKKLTGGCKIQITFFPMLLAPDFVSHDNKLTVKTRCKDFGAFSRILLPEFQIVNSSI